MLNQHQELTGTLFQTDIKYMTAQAANMRGTCKINNKIYYISAWNKGKDGKKYLSLLFKEAK